VTFPLGSPVYNEQVKESERPSLGQLLGMTLGIDGAAAPVLEGVEPDGPLGKSGLRRGDRLTRIAGHVPRDADEADLLLQHGLLHQEPFSIETADGRTFEVTDLPVPPRSLSVHPTQPYSAINALLICLFLLAYEPFRRRDGELFALMLTIYPVTRFLLEIIRTDESAIFGTGLSISQNVSLLVMLGVAALWFHILRRPRGTALPTAVES
jgi:phosphatidylglycerol:prolipoprotein diacylglycerol transferase